MPADATVAPSPAGAQHSAYGIRAFFYLFKPGDHMAPSLEPAMPYAVLEADGTPLRQGRNGLLYEGEARIKRVHTLTDTLDLAQEVPLDFQFFTPQARSASRQCAERLSPILARAGVPDLQAADDCLFPHVIGLDQNNVFEQYHFCDTALPGALFLSYVHQSHLAVTPTYAQLVQRICEGRQALAARHAILNDDCWYCRWSADEIPTVRLALPADANIWHLAVTLHERLAHGQIEPYIPELDRTFQTSDLETLVYQDTARADWSHRIMLTALPTGQMIATQSRPVERGGSDLAPSAQTLDPSPRSAERIAQELAGVDVAQTAAVRRVQFAVQLESLKTGNIYRASFATVRPRGVLVRQSTTCIISYLRTRTLQPIGSVHEELADIARICRKHLEDAGLAFMASEGISPHPQDLTEVEELL
jgi:hypothetical protein